MIKKPIKSVVNTPGRILRPSFRFPISSGGGGGSTPAAVSARYWRFVSRALAWNHNETYGISDIQVFTSPDCTGENIALEKPSFATFTYSMYTPNKANDESIDTYWFAYYFSLPEDYAYWGFDAESEVAVKSVSMFFQWSGHIPKEILIQYSNDNETWEDFATIAPEDLGYQRQEFTNLQ